jgi:hypothetical protein
LLSFRPFLKRRRRRRFNSWFLPKVKTKLRELGPAKSQSDFSAKQAKPPKGLKQSKPFNLSLNLARFAWFLPKVGVLQALACFACAKQAKPKTLKTSY